MKKNILFLAFFLIIGCNSSTPISTKISCPNVLFSSEHRNYISSVSDEISLEDLSYSAEINNYKFTSDCSLVNKKIQADLSLLFVVKPGSIEVNKITLPFYVAVLNSEDKILDIQYYQVTGTFKKNDQNGKNIESDLTKTIKFQFDQTNSDFASNNILVIGFMLDSKKSKILN